MLEGYVPPKSKSEIVRRYDAGERKFAWADLQGADLTGINLSGADLSHGSFTRAILVDTKLQETILVGANLAGSVGLVPAQLAGADLTNARLPDSIKFEGVNVVDKASENAKTLLISILGACVYSWLTIGTTTDSRLITNSTASPLPIVQTEIPIVGFYFAAPLLVIGLYVYLNIYLQRLYEVLADLPAVLPDGRSLDKVVHPWLLNGLVRVHSRRLSITRPPFFGLQTASSILLAWWIVPATLFLFWGRYLVRHDWRVTAVHITLIVTSLLASMAFYRVAIATIRRERVERLQWRIPFGTAGRRKGWVVILGGTTLLGLLSIGAIWGRPSGENAPTTSDDWRVTPILSRRPVSVDFRKASVRNLLLIVENEFGLRMEIADDVTGVMSVSLHSVPPQAVLDEILKKAGLEMRGSAALVRIVPQRRSYVARAVIGARDPWTWAPRAFEFLGYRAFADVHDADVSMRPSERVLESVRELSLSRGAILRGANLRYLQGSGAFFVKSDLRSVDLEGANLIEADLRQANLQYANLQSAGFQGARLEGANLRGARVKGANFLRANLQGARLGPNLRESFLPGADLTEASFFDDDLYKLRSEPPDLQKANLREAVLRGINLEEADLRAAKLERANLQNSRLDHTNLRDVQLTDAQLQGASLVEADLQGADLAGANLEGANLQRTNLRGVDLSLARGITRTQMRQANTDSTTRFPRNFR